MIKKCNWKSGCEPAEIYYNTGDTLPVDVPLGSIAINTNTWEISIFNGSTWTKKE